MAESSKRTRAFRSRRKGRRIVLLVTAEVILAGALIAVAVMITPRQGRGRQVALSGQLEYPEPEEEEEEGPRYVVPQDWMPSDGDDCDQWHGEEVCNGPRKVPRPHGPAAERAERLGLGDHIASRTLMSQGPPEEWVDEVRGSLPEALHWPVEGGKLWRHFRPAQEGDKRPPHKGIDVGAAEGDLLLAVADGLVGYADNKMPGYGNTILVILRDGSVALYAHCRASYVFAGQRVKSGQVIGEVGNTGISRAAHLHFELRVKGEPVDPFPLFQRWLDDKDRWSP